MLLFVKFGDNACDKVYKLLESLENDKELNFNLSYVCIDGNNPMIKTFDIKEVPTVILLEKDKNSKGRLEKAIEVARLSGNITRNRIMSLLLEAKGEDNA